MPDYQDRVLALLGIAATKQALDQPCPSENNMSAFIENRLDSSARVDILSHLNRCEDCYLTWEQLSVSVMQDNLDTYQPKVELPESHPSAVNCLNIGDSWQSTVLYLVLLLLAIGLIVNMLVISNTSMRNDRSTAAATIDAKTLSRSINQLPVPWKDQTFELNSSTYTVPAKAFGGGIWSARNALMNLNDPLPAQLVLEPTIHWQNSKWSNYYAFGQLTLDAWVLASAEYVKPTQWSLLRKSLQALEAEFKQGHQSEPEANIALQMISKMKANLDRLSRKTDLAAQRDLLEGIASGLQKFFI
jgi:hypothetical protein